jgi:uncharacterized damage-inducible protein DinB
MASVTEWFGRKFAHDLSLEMYPNVLARLRGTPARLEELLRGLSQEALTRRHDNKWSIQEQAGHLWDLEDLWLKRLDDFQPEPTVMTAADLQNRKTHEAGHNERDLTEILSGFRALRTEFVARMEQFDEGIIGRTALHPRLQTPMRVIDHGFFVAEHDDHHLATIWELKRS